MLKIGLEVGTKADIGKTLIEAWLRRLPAYVEVQRG